MQAVQSKRLSKYELLQRLVEMHDEILARTNRNIRGIFIVEGPGVTGIRHARR